ncbi:HAMP domain-containing sensor histidine kinase [Sphingomonas sp. G-3-2-10]|uniref:sensor histidine kinase n=1 Tax=Sphingomonas sp. G-3-2-10 TaxID=2728838 RepID=UPI00146BFD13|nr:HAMP domain-containing sensor histidine kinase [Sphingomonas sp. G-3-2-10]NML04995.1 HAMP domain-containing histidine kinase [Sphingomonas sp. G-3-2-10]
MRFFPRSLTGQIGLIVAAALFLAQAINFGLLLNERRESRFAQIVVPSVTRLADTAERLANPNADPQPDRVRRGPNDAERPGPDRARRGPPGYDQRTRVQVLTTPPELPVEPRRADIEDMVRQGFTDGGVALHEVIAVVRPIDESRPLIRHMTPERKKRLHRLGAELHILVHLKSGQWLALSTGWPTAERVLIWQLMAQTGILYIVVLIPVLLATRRIAKPLRRLATAAREFRPGSDAGPVEERGPSDVRSVIAAYNGLGQRVTAMLDEKDKMLGAIGHDLRTPLAALRVRIESVDDDEDRNRMADTIDEMNRTLDDILSLARLGRPSEPPTDVDLSALIDAVVEDFRDLDMPVAFEEAPRLKMRIRPNLMRRAVRNLIENAVKYGGGAEVRLVPGETSVAIDVCDRGPGIPADKIAAVFDPFTRLETSRNRETGGIGLGLALAKAIVSEAGGTIVLANREGGGLIATIRLPRG